ncbi:amidohydrolase/deacetylase family metallohydrolase [Streptomyces sp. CA-132043]|uniref:amidohydrolase/deacetylase family metallohydrolase n=1 Tax=Streptomyces sp. CA-132043 TaxID=3240048 RepID=UPI003D89DA19
MHPPDPYRFDLVVRGGLLADHERGTLAPGELAIRGGRVARTGPPGSLRDAPAERTYDATNLLVAPGLIDLHTHVYGGRTGLGVDADEVGVRQGVTTVADAGSCGSDHWDDFAARVLAPARTRVLSWLNISRHGLVHGTRELAGGPADIDVDATAALLVRERAAIRGIKVRMSASVLGDSGLAPLRAAKRLAATAAPERGRVPVMVHVGNAPPALGDVLDELGPGDVVTHAFHGKPGCLFGGGTAPVPQARAAYERGVRFDVGHGSASFSFATAERALDAGLRPYTISTDLHRRNIGGPVHSLATTLGKLLALGLPLPDVLACATAHAADVLGLADALGTLRPGAVADLGLLELREERVRLTDAAGAVREAPQCLVPRAAVRAGTVHPLAPTPKAAV